MGKKEIVRNGYNKAAEKVQELHGLEKEEEKLNLLEDFILRIPQGGQVLDAGCGNGAYSRYLSDKFTIIGVDISENQIKLARQNVPGVEFICADMTKLNFPSEHFDGILALYSIIHVPREEHYDLLKDIYRMLKNNGVALLIFGLNDIPEVYMDQFFDKNTKMYWSGFDKDKNLNMLREIGFKIIWFKSIKESPKWGDSSHLYVFTEKISYKKI